MPRIAGQIDRAKNEAILDATSDVVFERGLAAPLDEIARRAGVSKQTIYNHYGSKAELVRALIERRTQTISAPFEAPGAEARPETTLADYARALLETVANERGIALLRLLIAAAPHDPALAGAVLPRGARGTRLKLTRFLERESLAGRMAVPDPAEAADFFAGMVTSHYQMQGLLGLPAELTEARIERIAREAARRFMRAYAV
jgi:AcrR family transcriptional regulator